MRRTLFIAIPLVLILLLAHFVVWRWAEGQLETGLAAWADAQRRMGHPVTYGAPEEEGWPLRAGLSVPSLSISSAVSGADKVTWTAERAVLEVAFTSPGTLEIAPEGAQSVDIGTSPKINYTADRLTASVPLSQGAAPSSANINGGGIRIEAPMLGHGQPIEVALLNIHSTSSGNTARATTTVAGSAQDIALPPPPGAASWPLGDRIASVSVEGSLEGPATASGDAHAQLAAWQAAKGLLRIGRFAIGWGPLGLSGDATIDLDANLQPAGTAEVHLVGQNQTIDALAQAHVITPAQASTAKAVLGLLGSKNEGGVDLPLTLENQTLKMGQIPFLKLPRLDPAAGGPSPN